MKISKRSAIILCSMCFISGILLVLYISACKHKREFHILRYSMCALRDVEKKLGIRFPANARLVEFWNPRFPMDIDDFMLSDREIWAKIVTDEAGIRQFLSSIPKSDKRFRISTKNRLDLNFCGIGLDDDTPPDWWQPDEVSRFTAVHWDSAVADRFLAGMERNGEYVIYAYHYYY